MNLAVEGERIYRVGVIETLCKYLFASSRSNVLYGHGLEYLFLRRRKLSEDAVDVR